MYMGDFLNPHIDNSHNFDRTRYRRLNLLYYVTPEWKEEFGGCLELWDPHVSITDTIASRFNRLVVMETNDLSYHSVSRVVAPGSRCCVSNYFFSSNSPNGENYYHVTSFTGRPGQFFFRSISTLDNTVRNLFAKSKGVSRGKKNMRKL